MSEDRNVVASVFSSSSMTPRTIELESDVVQAVPLDSCSLKASFRDVIVCAISELKETRWKVAFWVCALSTGPMYVYDFPSIGMNTRDATTPQHTIQTFFESRGLVYTNTMNETLYAVYSYPNMILAAVGGILVDRCLGIRKSTVLFSAVVSLGAAVFWLGLKHANFPMMVVGRAIYGAGSESLCVAQSAFLSRWFQGTPLVGLAFMFMALLGTLGSTCGFCFNPYLAASDGIPFAALIGVLACTVSTLASVYLVCLDRYYEKRGMLGIAKEVALVDIESGESHEQSAGAKEYKKKRNKFPTTLWLMAFSWALCYNCVVLYSSFAIPYFMQVYHVTEATASSYISIFQLTVALSSPVLGLLYDLTGCGCFRMLLAPLLIGVYQTLQVLCEPPPAISMVVLALAQALFSSTVWAAVGLITAPEHTGVAFGLLCTVENIVGGIIPFILGTVLDRNTPMKSTDNPSPAPTIVGYNLAIWVLVVTAGFSAMFALLAWIVDHSTTRTLNAAPGTRKSETAYAVVLGDEA